jgi:hypothetical protein
MKEVKGVYNENYKTLKNKLKMILEDGKACHVHGSAQLYCDNGSVTKGCPGIQYNFHQNSNDIPQSTRKIYPKIHIEAQNTLNSQKIQNKTAMLAVPQDLISFYTQSHSNKISMVLAHE